MIPASWQSAVSNSGSIGIFIGVLINGWLTEKTGHRKLLLYCYALLTALIFIPFFAPSLGVLVAGEILCGLCWGQFSITAATYAAEVCPLTLRPYLTSYINISWIVGQLIAACVMRGVSGLDSKWAYKIPFGVQWVRACPESNHLLRSRRSTNCGGRSGPFHCSLACGSPPSHPGGSSARTGST